MSSPPAVSTPRGSFFGSVTRMVGAPTVHLTGRVPMPVIRARRRPRSPLELLRDPRDLARDVAAVLLARLLLGGERVGERADHPKGRSQRLLDVPDGGPSVHHLARSSAALSR